MLKDKGNDAHDGRGALRLVEPPSKGPARYSFACVSADDRGEPTTIRLTVPGVPIPLGRARAGRGGHYLPARSKAYRELVQQEWIAAGRPTLGDVPLALSARFYGARANADLSNLLKSVEDALNGLLFDDDVQICCLSGVHKLPVDDGGPRCELELWPVSRTVTA